jgi:hypothetical protein
MRTTRTRTRYGIVIPKNVDLAMDVGKSHEPARENGNRIMLVIDAFKI